MNPRMMGRHRNIEVMVVRLRPALVSLVIALTVSVAACGSRADDREEVKSAAPQASSPAPSAAAGATPRPSTSASRPRIVVLGDSLTAGLGLAPRDAYPALLQQRLDASGLDFEVVNAGVSGDTSAGGLARLDWALQGDVRILVVALGGNDALRALPAEELRRNLGAIIEKAQSRGITVMLAGMEAPPNFGRDYIVSFHNVYPALATQYHVAFVPFLLQGVAGSDALNQRDGIHPTAEGARILADTVWTVLKPLADTQRHTGS
jgi:acyl-CoA thioesterase-1